MAPKKSAGLFLFFSFQFLALSLVRAAGPGTTAADFLNIPVGARETALGGAFTAVAGNSGSVYYNPAGLGLQETPEVSFTYNKYLEGVSQQWLAAAYPYKSGAFGLGVNYLAVPSFDAYDALNNRTGSVSAYDLALYLSWGGLLPLDYKNAWQISYGASVKYISESLDSEKAAGFGLDLGLMVKPGVKNLRLGAGVENLALNKVRFIDEGFEPPLKFKTGAAYTLKSEGSAFAALLSADFNFPQNGKEYISGGLETRFYETFALRLGYSSFGEISNGLRFGLGFDLARYAGKNLSIDYSFGSTGDFGEIHKFGVTYKFGERAQRRENRVRRRRPARSRS